MDDALTAARPPFSSCFQRFRRFLKIRYGFPLPGVEIHIE